MPAELMVNGEKRSGGDEMPLKIDASGFYTGSARRMMGAGAGTDMSIYAPGTCSAIRHVIVAH